MKNLLKKCVMISNNLNICNNNSGAVLNTCSKDRTKLQFAKKIMKNRD